MQLWRRKGSVEGSSNEFLFLDSREIRWPRSRDHGEGRPASPRKVQGAGPFHCAGVKLLCTRHRREMAGRETRGRAEIEQGRGEHLAYSPFNLGNTLFLSVRAWNPPNTRRWKQDRLNKNNNNSQTLLGGQEHASHKRTVEDYKGKSFTTQI